MSAQNLSFQFKIDTITAREEIPPAQFSNGAYKPPVGKDDYVRRGTTRWHRFTMEGVSPAADPSPPIGYSYSTSVFYDAKSTNRFLFYPGDCQSVNISDVEGMHTERYGWQHLCFTHKGPGHTALDLDGEYDTLRGPPGSYSPHLLPTCYRSTEQSSTIGLSGKMSLLFALTAFSCRHDRMLEAISQRLNLKDKKWVNGDIQSWGHGRELQPEAIWSNDADCN